MTNPDDLWQRCTRPRTATARSLPIKILHRELAIESSIRARFLREGYAANKVGHLGAVSVLDDDTTEEGPRSRSLPWSRRSRLPWSKVVDGALAYEKTERWPDARTMGTEVRRAYGALLGAPISTARRLIVPADPDKTVVRFGGAPTAQPVSVGRTGIAKPRPANSPQKLLLAAGAALLFVVLIIAARAAGRSSARNDQPQVPPPAESRSAAGATINPPSSATTDNATDERLLVPDTAPALAAERSSSAPAQARA